MSMEWIYSNLVTIIIILCVATVILFLFPVILGWDLLKRVKNDALNYQLINGYYFSVYLY